VLQKRIRCLPDRAQTAAVKQHKKICAEHRIAVVQTKSPGTPSTPGLQKGVKRPRCSHEWKRERKLTSRRSSLYFSHLFKLKW